MNVENRRSQKKKKKKNIHKRKYQKMSFRPIEREDEKDVDVTWEDQKRINAFGRLNTRRHELTDAVARRKVRKGEGEKISRLRWSNISASFIAKEADGSSIGRDSVARDRVVDGAWVSLNSPRYFFFFFFFFCMCF